MNSPHRSSPTKSKPVVSPRRFVSSSPQGGTSTTKTTSEDVPPGFEHRQRVWVYASPMTRTESHRSTQQDDESTLPAVWSQPYTIARTPAEIWIFEQDRIPEKLKTYHEQNQRPMGVWGYSTLPSSPSSSSSSSSDPKRRIVVVPPKKTPPAQFVPQGHWTFPLVQRNEQLLEDDQAGFLAVGDYVTKEEALDVAGNWRILCHRPGGPEEDENTGVQIHVQKDKDPNTRISLKVKPTVETIGDIKRKIKEQFGIPKKEQLLRHPNGKTLLKDDQTTLHKAGIQNGDVLTLDPMEIYVQEQSTGKIYTITPVLPSDTISQIKHQLETKHIKPNKNNNIPKDGLIFQSKPCIDEKTLRQHGIQHQSTLMLKDEPKMMVRVRLPNGQNVITVPMKPTQTIQELQEQIQDREGIPVPDQRLAFHSKPLASPRATLAEENVQDGDTIDMEPMRIHVKTPKGKILDFDVQPTDTIDSIKQRVQKRQGIPLDEQRMSFHSNELKDNQATLQDLGIKHKDTIDMEPMHIIVKDWTGKKFRVDCEPNDTIDAIKDKIEKQQGHPKPKLFLIKDGDVLQDPKTLKDYGVQHKDEIDLDRMMIYVKDPKGNTFPLEVDPDEPIEDVKKKINNQQGHPVPQQILKFKDNVLEEPKSLADYDIKYKDVIDLKKKMPETPKTPPQVTYNVQLSQYKSPLEQTYVSPTVKRKGKRTNTKEAYKHRWHTDQASEEAELARAVDEKCRLQEKSP